MDEHLRNSVVNVGKYCSYGATLVIRLIRSRLHLTGTLNVHSIHDDLMILYATTVFWRREILLTLLLAAPADREF